VSTQNTSGSEVPKRLGQTKATIRHLFAHSGNVCAYAGCRHPLIDGHGNFVAELCHIEAAEPGGERFNPAMTNAERSDRDNLLLLCHRHHVETNDVHAWPVERMRELKAEHERRYEESEAVVAEHVFVDITKGVAAGQPVTLARFADVLGWDLTPEQVDETRTEMLLPLLENLAKLAPDTRALLLIVLERGEERDDEVALPFHELEQVTGHGRASLVPHLDTLRRYGVTSVVEDWDDREWVATRDLNGWPFWSALKDYCSKTGLELQDFVMGLRFDLLD
jgi:hypothetical protein